MGRRKKNTDPVIVPEMESAGAKPPWEDEAAGPDPVTEAEEPPAKSDRFSGLMMSILSGNILSRAEVRKVYPYLLFVAFLAFVYITNVFRTQTLYRRHNELSVEVKELRAKSMTLASERAEATRQSAVVRELERRGIDVRESLTPNKVIRK